jgi:hypothetical protein
MPGLPIILINWVSFVPSKVKLVLNFTRVHFLFFPVQECKYEKVHPTLDGIDYKSSKLFSFTISPSTEYFTRYLLCTLAML